MGKVFTHARFGATDRLKELEEQGVVVIDETRSYDDLDLPEPQYGEQIVGELEPEEKAIFFALADSAKELEDKVRTLMGNQITKVGSRIRDSDRNKSLREAMEEDGPAFESDEEARQFFRLEKQVEMLKATFHWNVAERLDRHQFVLGVRSRGRVVTTERRY